MKEGLIGKLSRAFSLITGGVAVTAILFGVFRFVENTRNNAEIVNGFNEKLDRIEAAIAKQDSSAVELQSAVEALSSELGGVAISLNNTQKSYARYLMRDNTLTKEEFYRYMEGLEVKKNQ